MTRIFRFLRKLGYQARRKSLRRELSEELALHADYKFREFTERGLPAAVAVTRMRREMGNTTLALELSSDVRNFRFLEELMQDLRYALRINDETAWPKSSRNPVAGFGHCRQRGGVQYRKCSLTPAVSLSRFESLSEDHRVLSKSAPRVLPTALPDYGGSLN